MSASSIGLLWYAKDHHPDPAVREAIAAAVRNQVARSPFAEQRGTVRDLLEQEQGTVLEPFVFDQRDLDDACDLACLAGEVIRELLVVSRDKLEPLGGVLLRLSKDGPVARHIERRAGHGIVNLGQMWRFAPGLEPDEDALKAGMTSPTAQVLADERGHVVRCGPFPEVDGTGPIGDSVVLITPSGWETGPHWRADVERESGGGVVSIRPATPEDAIQATALMMQGRWLSIGIARDARLVPAVVVQLALPQPDGPRDVAVLPVVGDEIIGRISRWLLTDNVRGVVDRFGPGLVAETGRSIGLASGWESSVVRESAE